MVASSVDIAQVTSHLCCKLLSYHFAYCAPDTKSGQNGVRKPVTGELFH